MAKRRGTLERIAREFAELREANDREWVRRQNRKARRRDEGQVRREVRATLQRIENRLSTDWSES